MSLCFSPCIALRLSALCVRVSRASSPRTGLSPLPWQRDRCDTVWPFERLSGRKFSLTLSYWTCRFLGYKKTRNRIPNVINACIPSVNVLSCESVYPKVVCSALLLALSSPSVSSPQSLFLFYSIYLSYSSLILVFSVFPFHHHTFPRFSFFHFLLLSPSFSLFLL